ncbi:MAG: hypothetical protein M1444_04595 [Patescibacteria group bacterium]|nr:hypothetical protein [Patescibacteria group bacterium]
MKDRINPVPEIIADQPDAHHGNLLDGLVKDLGRLTVHKSNSEDNSLHAIGPDNFRGREEGVVDDLGRGGPPSRRTKRLHDNQGGISPQGNGHGQQRTFHGRR